MNRNQILDKAKETLAKRGESYGEAHESLDRAAGMWSCILGVDVEAHQVAACMIAMKLSRLHNDPAHFDSIMDIAGYAALWSECVEIGTANLYDERSHE